MTNTSAVLSGCDSTVLACGTENDSSFIINNIYMIGCLFGHRTTIEDQRRIVVTGSACVSVCVSYWSQHHTWPRPLLLGPTPCFDNADRLRMSWQSQAAGTGTSSIAEWLTGAPDKSQDRTWIRSCFVSIHGKIIWSFRILTTSHLFT